MSKDLAIGIVIGGAVSATLGAALGKTRGMVGDLQKKMDDTRGLRAMIGETQRLQREYRTAFMAGSAEADKIRRKIERQSEALKKAGVHAGELEASYVKLGRAIKGMEWQQIGATQMQSGVEIGRTAATAAATFAVPTKISADYQAIIRDIAIKGDIAGTSQEKTLDASIRKAASANGMGQADLANAANALVSNGMSIERVIANLDVIGKFAVGQGSNGDETAKMVFAMSQAGVRDADMRQALEAVAYQGKQGSFESADMAKWLPSLLPEMNKLGIYGKDAVIQLGAMLQVQKKASGSADEAAGNLKNWLSKIGAGDTKKNYEKAGIDYEKSMAAHIKVGMSPLEASMALAKQYIERVDPKKAAQMRQKADQISSIKDEAERKRQLNAFSESMKMGDLFGDMQVKTALTAYMQNDAEYASLKKGGETASGVLDKGLEQRREASAQKWKETGEAFQSAMVTVGDAIRPVTDRLADLAAGALKIGSAFATANPGVALAALGVTIGGLGVAAMKIGSGGALWAAGKALERVGVKLPGGKSGGAGGGSGAGGLVGRALEAVTGGAGVQKVFVTNWDGAGGGGGLPDIPTRAKGGAATRGAGAASKLASIGKIGGALVAVGTAGYMAYDTYKNAKTPEQKGAGYGGAGGALAGGLAGAKVGAALGAFGGPVGMAVGGLVGGGIGALGGEKLGAWIGKAIAQHGKLGAALAAGGAVTGAALLARKHGGGLASAVAGPIQGLAGGRSGSFAGEVAAEVGKKLAEQAADRVVSGGGNKPPSSQSFTFNPTIQVTVKGDVKDPRQVANEIAPHLRKIFDGWVAQAKRSAMHDPAGA